MKQPLRRNKMLLLSTLAFIALLGAWMAREGVAQTPAPATAETENPKVKITFQTHPAVKADVWWGKKKLGTILDRRRPLVVERPRDSGPMDITIRAQGFLPVHTRASTFDDQHLSVKLTEVAEKHTLFGYRAAAPDAGAPVDPQP